MSVFTHAALQQPRVCGPSLLYRQQQQQQQHRGDRLHALYWNMEYTYSYKTMSSHLQPLFFIGTGLYSQGITQCIFLPSCRRHFGITSIFRPKESHLFTPPSFSQRKSDAPAPPPQTKKNSTCWDLTRQLQPNNLFDNVSGTHTTVAGYTICIRLTAETIIPLRGKKN